MHDANGVSKVLWGTQVPCDLLQKVELLHAAGTIFTPTDAKDVVRTFYDVLTILDTKGLALLAFDGIIVAATTFAAEKGGVFGKPGLPRFLAILVIVLSLAAAVACLFVSEISYPFFHYVSCNQTNGLDFSAEISRLSDLVTWRTDYFIFAWWCSITAIPLFGVMFWTSFKKKGAVT
jgi:hypothetical protein